MSHSPKSILRNNSNQISQQRDSHNVEFRRNSNRANSSTDVTFRAPDIDTDISTSSTSP